MDQDQVIAKSSRVFGLDVFRSFAILFVLIGHSFEHSHLSPDIKTLGHLGILGVELFFVLSGFLIGSIIMRLIRENRFHSLSDISQFWKRRWLRTLPLYFVALLAFIRFDYHGRHDLLEYPAYFVFMQSFSYPIPEFFELSWSLAIEEHFYFWFPLAFLLWERVTRKAHLAIVLSAISLIVVVYVFRLSQPMFSDWNDYNRSIRLTVLSRIDAIMFGVLMAAMKEYWMAGFVLIRRATPVAATAFVIVCAWWFSNAPGLMQSRALQVNLYSAQAVLCALLLPWFDNLRQSGSSGKFFTVTSKLSYSLYLVHILVIIAVNNALGFLGMFDRVYGNPWILYPVYFSLFYLVSWVTYHLIEEPFLRLREGQISLGNVARESWVAVATAGVLIAYF